MDTTEDLTDDELVRTIEVRFRKRSPAADRIGMERNWQAIERRIAEFCIPATPRDTSSCAANEREWRQAPK